jgi:hypothetical protein
MRAVLVLLLTVAAMFAADDPWGKVKDLKTGAELRIFRKGSVKTILATLDQADDDNLIVVVKNEEIAIPREDVDRLDARPKQGATGPTKQSQTVQKGPEGEIPSPQGHPPGPSTSSNTSYSFGSKPDFQTIYRRPPPMKKNDSAK